MAENKKNDDHRLNGRFELIRELGRGGQARVYKAVDRFNLNRPVALKLLLDHSPSRLLHFEFEQLAKLVHPNLASVFELDIVERAPIDTNIEPGCIFFTQQYIDGITAADLVSERPANEIPELVAKVGISVGRALEFLHSHHVIHRDVKPSNILVGQQQNDAKLIDLGLASLLGDTLITRGGTLRYMAPEAIEGYADERSDLFSLGVCLAELLGSKRTSFDDTKDLKRPEGVPDELWRAVRMLLVPKPEARIQTAREAVLTLARSVETVELGNKKTKPISIDASSRSDSIASLHARVRCPELVGRKAELDRLEQTIAHTLAAQRFRAVLLAGRTGIGKSRLFRSASVKVQLQMVSRSEPAPVVLAGTLRDLAKQILGGEGHGEWGVVDRWLGAKADGETDDSIDKNQVMLALAKLILSLDTPIVLLIEDGDEQLFSELLPVISGLAVVPRAPLLMVAEMRGEERANELSSRHGVDVVNLGPLSKEAEGDLVLGALAIPVNDDALDQLRAMTGGIPAVTEAALSRLLAANSHMEQIDMPAIERLKDGGGAGAIQYEVLAGLSDSEQLIMQVLAVCGFPVEIALLQKITDQRLAPEALSQEVIDLIRRQWVLVHGRDRLFLPRHVAEGIIDGMNGGELEHWNRTIATALSDFADGDPVRIGRHAVAGKHERLVNRWAIEAAGILRGSGDLNGAIEQLESFLDVHPVGDKWNLAAIELSRLYRDAGRYDRALSFLDSCGSMPEPYGVEALVEKGRVLRLSGQTDAAIAVLEEVASRSSGQTGALARCTVARIHYEKGDLETAAEWINDAKDHSDSRIASSSYHGTAGLISLAKGQLKEATDLFDAGLAGAPDDRTAARFWSLKGMVAHRQADWIVACECYNKALEIAKQVGDFHGAATYEVNLASAYTELDEIGHALARYHSGLMRLKAVGRTSEYSQAAANYAQLLLRVGDLDSAEKASELALQTLGEFDESVVAAHVLCVRGAILMAAGTHDQANDLLGRSHELSNRHGLQFERLVAVQHLAENALNKNDLDQAEKWLDLAADSLPEDASNLWLEQMRISVEIAMVKGDNISRAVANLAALLAPTTQKYRLEQLKALVCVARGSAACEDVDQSSWAARCALNLMKDSLGEIPSMHRNIDDDMRSELREIVGEETSASLGEPMGIDLLGRMLQINKRLNSELRLGRLLELIVDNGIEITGAERGFVLVSGGKGELKVRAARNIDRESLAPKEQSFSRSIALRAFERAEAVLTTNAQQDERFSSNLSVVDLNLRYIVAVPLNLKGETIGALYVDSRHAGQLDKQKTTLLSAMADQAAIAIHNAQLVFANRRRERQIEKLNRQLQKKLASSQDELAKTKNKLKVRESEQKRTPQRFGIVARSKEMELVFSLIEKVAGTDLPVVIQGESGTGKELVAKAIHSKGDRRNGNFVAENCAAIPENLFESVLFGHVRGAFTGAVTSNNGLFAEANRGTLFLDEVADMPLQMQSKLLRALQESEVRPVGSNKSLKIDVRVVVATNSDLAKMVRKGEFREDLYYRLNVVKIDLPPLRDRREDIVLLAEYFVRQHALDETVSLSKEACEALIDYNWPGNVRQLENEIMRAVVLSHGAIGLEQLSEDLISAGADTIEQFDDFDMNSHVDRLKKRLVSAALNRTGGNQTAAASLLGLSRYGLQKMMGRLGLI